LSLLKENRFEGQTVKGYVQPAVENQPLPIKEIRKGAKVPNTKASNSVSQARTQKAKANLKFRRNAKHLDMAKIPHTVFNPGDSSIDQKERSQLWKQRKREQKLKLESRSEWSSRDRVQAKSSRKSKPAIETNLVPSFHETAQTGTSSNGKTSGRGDSSLSGHSGDQDQEVVTESGMGADELLVSANRKDWEAAGNESRSSLPKLEVDVEFGRFDDEQPRRGADINGSPQGLVKKISAFEAANALHSTKMTTDSPLGEQQVECERSWSESHHQDTQEESFVHYETDFEPVL